MSFHLDFQGPDITLQDIQQLEEELNISLPSEYVDFLLQHNGGQPSKMYFHDDFSTDVAINLFYGLNYFPMGDGEIIKSLDLKTNFLRLVRSGRIRNLCIPIANTQTGDQICIDLSIKMYGQVFVWQHEFEDTDEDTFYISVNLFSFLQSLQTEEDYSKLIDG